MENDPELIIVQARFYLKTTAEGGRSNGIKTGYRPNHVFEIGRQPLQAYIGDVQFKEQEIIQPGETRIVTIRFLRSEKIEKFIQVGRKWLVYEVPRIVGEAEITEIISK